MSSMWTSSINNTWNHKTYLTSGKSKKETQVFIYIYIYIKHTHTQTHSCTYPRNDLSLAFFSPLAHFGINLLADFRLDLSGVSGEESQEALRAAVDDVNLVEWHCVDHLLPLLQLSLWTLYKLCLKGWQRNTIKHILNKSSFTGPMANCGRKCKDLTGYLRSHGIIVSGSGEGAAQLADLSRGFVNGNNISEIRT